jgi:hypothetical protein
LGRIAHHFIDSGIVRDADSERFDATLTATRRLLNSTMAEILTIVLAFAAAGALRVSAHTLPVWMTQPENGLVASAAGFWHAWISLPLLFILFFGWLWRQLLWSRLMWSIARFNLKLVAAHPDHSGGLTFLGTALRGYQPLVFALATIVAGGLANHIRDGANLYDLRFYPVGLVVTVLVLFVGPYFVFLPALQRLKDQGMLEYGALTSAVGHEFEGKWIRNGRASVTCQALEAPDFSATTDLYQIASNVYQVRYMPLDTRAVIELVISTLIPFVPVVLLSVPLQVLLHALKQILS